MALPAAVGFVINAISNMVVGIPLVLTRVSVGFWALKYANELEPGVIHLPKDDPARLAAERELIDRFMQEVLPLTSEQSDFERSIEEIKKKAQIASTYPSPIILDLDGDGVIGTVGLGAGVYFDHAANGFAERTGWVAPGDGLLVWDRNANGTIDSGRELFGSETPLHLARKAVNGFEALKFHDANGDGIIDANDPVFAELRVWVDANSDARTDTGELLTLEEAGVKSINLAYTNSTFVDAHGHEHRQVGSYTTTDGETRAATDVWFKADATYSVPTEWVDVPEDIAALPDVNGYGKVRDLHQAMAMDSSGQLQAMVVVLGVNQRGGCVNDAIWRLAV